MPKSQYIDPTQMRKPGEITFTPIPVNQYNKTVKDELKAKHFTKDDLKRIYRDMVVIREFETMLQLVKTTGGYNGVEYNNPGPAHLSAGQEAAAVGMAYMPRHQRLHFRIAPQPRRNSRQGSVAPSKLLGRQEPREDHERASWNGATVNVAKKAFKGEHARQRAGYPTSCFTGRWPRYSPARPDSTSGLGGSMHTFFTPFGIYPNNAIVGGSGSIAVGAALYKKVNRKPGIVVANLGDASMARGPVLGRH